MKEQTQIRELINRLARLESASAWDGDLNPSQRAVLGYLGRANRFSRSPSHVSDYLGTTRGTISQSLKSLLQKGYVQEQRSEQDKRVISYTLTKTGREVAQAASALEDAVTALDESDRAGLHRSLTQVVQNVLHLNGGQEFGPCHTCIHHRSKDTGAHCALLDVALAENETDLICFEQVSA